MIFRKAEKEDFYKIRSLYWTLIDQEQDDPSFPHWKKGIHPSDEMIQDSIDTRQLYAIDKFAEAFGLCEDQEAEREKDLQTLIDAVCEQEPGIPKYEQSIQDAVKALHTD